MKRTPIAQEAGNNPKNSQAGFIPVNRLCLPKETDTRDKRPPNNKEKSLPSTHFTGDKSRIYELLQKSNAPPQSSHLTNEKRNGMDSSQRKKYRGVIHI